MTIMRCYTCVSWRGDKVKVASRMDEYPICMDLHDGWPETGDCGISYRWLTLTVDGNATVDIEVPANFGCPYWSAEKGERHDG